MNEFFRLGLQCPSSYNPADFFIKVLPQASDKIPIENDSVSALDAQPAVIYESIGNICLKQHEKCVRNHLENQIHFLLLYYLYSCLIVW